MSRDNLPTLHLATPVWGAEYVRLFLDTVLPTLFASGNLPALGDVPRVYRIFTTTQHLDAFRSHPSYRILERLLRVELVDTELVFQAAKSSSPGTTKYDLMTIAYNEALRLADEANGASVFLNADMIFADGSLANMVELFKSGKRAIEIEGFRTNKEVMEHSLHARWEADDGAIKIPPRELVKLSLQNIHRISRKHFWKNPPSDPFLPFHTYWHVGEAGLIGRATHLYPLLVFPDKKFVNSSHTIDRDLLDRALSDMDAAYIVSDSDLIYSCELSDTEYDIHVPFSEKRFSAMREFIADRSICSPRNRRTLRTPIIFHVDEPKGIRWWWGKVSTSFWASAVTDSGFAYLVFLLWEKKYGWVYTSNLARRLYRQASQYGFRALAGILVYALLRPLFGSHRARHLGKTVRDNFRSIPAYLTFVALRPFLGHARSRRIALGIRDRDQLNPPT